VTAVTGVPSARLEGASSTPYWLDQAQRPAPRPAHTGDVDVDLLVVGGGFTGLWAAVLALEEQPGRDVLVLEAHRLGWAASGRNGGFCAASLTHGLANGFDRWPADMPTLLRLGRQNLDEIQESVRRYGIDCGFERTGELDVAVEPWQVEGLREDHELAQQAGVERQLLDATETRALVDSPTYLGGLYDPDGVAMVDPARLVWGLADVVERLGGLVRESTRVLELLDLGDRVLARTPAGSVRARQVVLGTNVFPSPVKRYRRYVVPVWDHVLVTEPLDAEQRRSVGWAGRQGVGDAGNRFHYYRLTADDRLLFGGYDALYYFGNDMSGRRARAVGTETMLAQHLVRTFPVLDGITVSHAWGGAIDTCTRFCAFWGTSHGGKVAAVQGYTGLGVGATRFGAQVCLDLLAGRSNERTQLEMVRRKPVPFPPEPFRWTGIQLTRRALARADRDAGRRGPWLRALDRLGLGFDS
jgi:glycine/D-amino acid oxidase-like deaminating enzyme